MADILREDLLQKLNDLARQSGRSVDDLVEDMLNRYTMESQDGSAYPDGSLAALAQNALEADIHTGASDTAERSREILNTEFVDYLKGRMTRDASSD